MIRNPKFTEKWNGLFREIIITPILHVNTNVLWEKHPQTNHQVDYFSIKPSYAQDLLKRKGDNKYNNPEELAADDINDIENEDEKVMVKQKNKLAKQVLLKKTL